MGKKRSSQPPPPPPAEERGAVTAERFTRLYRLLQFLASGPKTRDQVTRHLGLDVRGFYRDLEFLRGSAISVTLTDGSYALVGELDAVLARLPFPDPRLTLGEARQLAKGRTRAHRFLQEQIEKLVS